VGGEREGRERQRQTEKIEERVGVRRDSES